MKPNVKKLLLVFLVTFFLAMTASAQAEQFDDTVLTQNGRAAYKTLLDIQLFAIGGVGYSGTISTGEHALDVLIEDKESVDSFKSLISSAKMEGSLYGLFGLRMLNCDCFENELAKFKKIHLTSENISTFKAMSGCLGSNATTPKEKTNFFESYYKIAFNREAIRKECLRQTNGRGLEIMKCSK